MIYLTRKEHFNAAHKLYNSNWSEEKNNEVFGKCANKNWHGHNYNLYVTVKGFPSEDTGFIIDAKKLSNIINEKVIDKLDHKNLNIDIGFKGLPSTENMTIWIFNKLKSELKSNNCELHCIKLQETENIYCEYFGE